jgi:hypothetical protein
VQWYWFTLKAAVGNIITRDNNYSPFLHEGTSAFGMPAKVVTGVIRGGMSRNQGV